MSPQQQEHIIAAWTMAEATTYDVPSPASVPSLAALSSQASTDEESLRLMSEIPANSTSKSSSSYDFEDDPYLGFNVNNKFSLEEESFLGANTSVRHDDSFMSDSWQSILDQEDEDGASQMSSGILSSDTLDLDADMRDLESLHSLSSAKTLKSPSGRLMPIIDDEDDGIRELSNSNSNNAVEFERVDTDDLPVHRACHGALNITPKQLAGVFSLFSSERKSKDTPKVEDTQQVQLAPVIGPAFVPATTSQPAFVPATSQPKEDPHLVTVEERLRAQPRDTQPKLTAELYWKPRAKSLEKECETLKEILTNDSSKMLQLKGALEGLRSDKQECLEDLNLCQDQLASAQQELVALKEEREASQKELQALKKERDVFLENETEYKETIRILKHEVDMLTRETKKPSPKSTSKKRPKSVDPEEMKQLRLENQLFASQIVDYEAELERLELQVHTQKGPRREEGEPRAENSIGSGPDFEGVEMEDQGMPLFDGSSVQDDVDVQSDTASMSPATSPEAPVQAFNKATLLSQSSSVSSGIIASSSLPSDVGDLLLEMEIESVDGGTVGLVGEGTVGVDVEKAAKVMGDEEKVAMAVDDSHGPENCMDKLTAGMPTEIPQQIIGNVLGMFRVHGSEEGKEADDKHEVFLIHQTATAQPGINEKVNCLQWRSPNQLPTLVKVDNIVPLEKVEDRNPPSTTSFGEPLSDKTNLLPSLHNQKVKKQPKSKPTKERENTSIEVVQGDEGGADEPCPSIEIQLVPHDPSITRERQQEDVPKKTTCPETFSDKDCDVWGAFSGCPFSSSSP